MSIEFAVDVGDFCSYIVVRLVGVAGVSRLYIDGK